jgi:hypothetical protein
MDEPRAGVRDSSTARDQRQQDLDLLTDVVLGLAELNRAITAQADGWLGAELEEALQRLRQRRADGWRDTPPRPTRVRRAQTGADRRDSPAT